MSRVGDVSAAVATLARPAELEATLRSVLAGTVIPRQIVVVDASADDATRAAVARLTAVTPNVEFVYERTTPGRPAQRNRALALTRERFVLWLDDDFNFAPDFLEQLLTPFADDGVGGACGLIVNQLLPSRATRFGQWLFRQTRYGARSFYQRSALPTFLYRPTAPARVEALTGGLALVRRDAVADFRVDPRLNYFDDDDLSLHLVRGGWRLWQWPAARCEHRGAAAGRAPWTAKVRRAVVEQRLLHRRYFPQDIATVACYYYSVLGAAVIAAARLKPRQCAATLLGLADVLRGRAAE